MRLWPAMLRIATLGVAVTTAAAMGGGGGVQCPTQAPWHTGDPALVGTAAPLRGNIGCVDEFPLSTRPIDGRGQAANNIYGPMEAGFTSQQWSCLGERTIPGGIDTLLAENMLHFMCDDDSLEILDFCGGHATPYHYHEHMDCLDFGSDTGHSSRIGTANDGRGIYGKLIDGGLKPTDLDICGGRYGVTPDSNGEVVYYYVTTEEAPFTAGCFGPINTLEQCRALYPDCNNEHYEITTVWGSGEYDLDCPCFDEFGSNVPGQGRPPFLEPLKNGAHSSYAHVNEAAGVLGATDDESGMGTKSGVLLALGVLGLVGAAMLLVRRHGRYEPKADLLGPSVNNMLRRVGGGGMRYEPLASAEGAEVSV